LGHTTRNFSGWFICTVTDVRRYTRKTKTNCWGKPQQDVFT
jgi:hypothetical protein